MSQSDMPRMIPAIGAEEKALPPRPTLEITKDRPLTDCKCNSCKSTNDDLQRMIYGEAQRKLAAADRQSTPEVPSRSSIIEIDESEFCIPPPEPKRSRLVEVHDEFWKDPCWTSTSKNIFK